MRCFSAAIFATPYGLAALSSAVSFVGNLVWIPFSSTEPEKIQAAEQAAIEETGAASSKDFGRVMKAAMTKLADLNVDGKMVNKLVKERLGDT